MFSRTVRLGMIPCVLRSSGMKPKRRRIASRGEVNERRLAVDRDAALGRPVDAEEQPRDFGAPGAEQPGEADDFAFAEIEVERLDRALPRQAASRQGSVLPRVAAAAADASACASTALSNAASSRPIIFAISSARGSSASGIRRRAGRCAAR